MIRESTVDEFIEKQPQQLFREELKKAVVRKIHAQKSLKSGFSPMEIGLDLLDFASEPTLMTVKEDFETFLKENGRAGTSFSVVAKKIEGLEKEEFLLEISKNGCLLKASETEGVRRGLLTLEDMLVETGGNLREETVHRKSIIKRRITRCFFSPTNRSGRKAELEDDVDYYPDGYLNRLMHDGINGIWIYSDFRSLIKSSYITEMGEDSERQIKKLNDTIAQCARYGIEVFIFAIEPISLDNPSLKKYPNLLQKYKETNGNVYYNKLTQEKYVAFCTYTELGKNYCVESTESLFKSAPNLGGYMSITQGERVTSCSTVWENEEGEWKNTCPHCAQYSKPQILCQKLEVLREGMRRSKPSAEFISWTYEHRFWEYDKIIEYVEQAPADVVLMQNFEDNGRVEQLGKKRVAMDYWLSYVGPSEMFSVTAKRAKELGKTMYAKMQICCSHEVATVPYVPVPGIIYDKLTKAKELGVTGIMESWYFGNYPCLMSKAVEVLSDNRVFESKRQFLDCLAGLYYPKNECEKVVRGWEYFEKGYTMYPVNVMFSYYGPLHDGLVWELSLLPKNFSLPRSWLLKDKPDGDRIGECLFSGHTLEEAIELCSGFSEYWKKGIECFSELDGWAENENEQFFVVKALGLMVESCKNILCFYKLRNDLGYELGDGQRILREMEEIVKREIENSKKMLPLCEQDSRLGFHSEAEGYKYFPEKLQDRCKKLQTLLDTEFVEVKARLRQKLSPLAYYQGEEEGVKSYQTAAKLEAAPWEFLSDGVSKFRIAITEEEIQMEFFSPTKKDFVLCNEMRLTFPQPAVILKSDGQVIMHRDTATHQSLNDERIEIERQKWKTQDIRRTEGETRLFVRLQKREVDFLKLPYRCMIKTRDGAFWCKDATPVYALGKSVLSPADFGWIK